jgi:hypothetical protein
MYRDEIYVETGKSVAGVSGSTWFGVLLGDSKSVNSINRWIFNTNQRTYKRKKQVWVCGKCSGRVKIPISKPVKLFLYAIVAIFIILLLSAS